MGEGQLEYKNPNSSLEGHPGLAVFDYSTLK